MGHIFKKVIIALLLTSAVGLLSMLMIKSESEMALTDQMELNLNNIVNLILDFDGVTFMDSSGIGMIAGRYKEINARGGKVMLIRVNSQIDKILEISGLKKILECTNA